MCRFFMSEFLSYRGLEFKVRSLVVIERQVLIAQDFPVSAFRVEQADEIQ